MNNEDYNMITVLMSVYKENIEQLKESIESILNQTYKNFEFLIINDGNNIDLIRLIEYYNDSRIRLINNKQNMGLEKSLNKGIKLAKGKYIVRMDADDISYKDRIKKQLIFIEQHPEYALVSGNAKIFDEKGIYGETHINGEVHKNELIKGTPFIHPTMIINREILVKIGGYPYYKRVEDYAMVMNLYAHGYKGYVMSDFLIKYRMDEEGYKKKKFRYRITEAKIKIIYFNKMRIRWYNYILILKPIIAGLIPKGIMKKYQKKKLYIK